MNTFNLVESDTIMGRMVQSLGKLIPAVGIALILTFAIGCATFQGNNEEDEALKQAEWHYEMGYGYFDANDTTYAIRELTTALELNPDHAQAHFLLGIIYMGRRDHTRAMRHYRETLRIEPAYYGAQNNLGTVYLEMGRWDEAAEVFEDLLGQPLYTSPQLAHNNLGWAYFNMGRHAEALEHLRMASFLSPEMCLADNNMGRVYEEMGNQRDAERHYRLAIEKCPTNYQEPHFYLGRLLQSQGNSNAAAHFRRCIEIQSRSNMAERCRQYLSVN